MGLCVVCWEAGSGETCEAWLPKLGSTRQCTAAEAVQGQCSGLSGCIKSHLRGGKWGERASLRDESHETAPRL